VTWSHPFEYFPRSSVFGFGGIFPPPLVELLVFFRFAGSLQNISPLFFFLSTTRRCFFFTFRLWGGDPPPFFSYLKYILIPSDPSLYHPTFFFVFMVDVVSPLPFFFFFKDPPESFFHPSLVFVTCASSFQSAESPAFSVRFPSFIHVDICFEVSPPWFPFRLLEVARFSTRFLFTVVKIFLYMLTSIRSAHPLPSRVVGGDKISVP